MKKIILMMIAFTAPSLSYADQNISLGHAAIGNRPGSAVINVPNTCGITKLRLRALGEKAYIDNVTIEFVSNQAPRERTQIRTVLRAGESTNWIQLNGQRRCIDKVFVAGNSQGSPRASRVEVIGHQETAYIPGRPRPHPGGGQALGQAMISEGFNARYVNVANVCRIRQVKIQVKGDDARIDYLAIRFGNGQIQRVDVRENFRAGSESQWKDLSGQNRCIDGFFVVGRSSRNPRDARVVLVGR